MSRPYIKRSLEPVLKRAANEFPAIVLTGPRQSGKTTLLKHLFGDSCRYVSLELPDVRAAANEDPRGFLEIFSPPVIMDEVQYAPDLLPYVKERIDARREVPGQYLLTGSQNLLVMEKITESLAGRTAMLRLMPLSRREAEGRPAAVLPWETGETAKHRRESPAKGVWSDFARGGFPELVAHPERDIGLWHAGYVQTYLERDVRSVRQVADLSQFQSFLRALAARSAQLLDLTDLSKDLGVSLNTIKAWLSVLEATYQVIVLRPYFENLGKRLVKRPKVYFSDTGTLCYLTGLKDPEHAASGPLAGPLMETAVLTEIFKAYTHRGLEPRIYFWRTSAGAEVDIVVEAEGKILPVEVKVSGTPRPAMAAAVRTFQKDFGAKAGPGFVVHPGSIGLPLGPGVTALPFSEL
ncbi:MAG: ATP-binding protein [Candidatus Aminicenantes bacterium]|nr:ATP-binding protein [Candidatus Aminicenantes bacterium]